MSLEIAAARDAAISASLAKSSFLANMSHEIRTPLNAISGMVLLLRRTGVTPVQNGQLCKIETASQHLLSVISAILDLSKIEAGKLTLVEQGFDLQTLLTQAVTMVADRAAAKSLQLVSEVAVEHTGLLGDAGCLQQCLLNLLSNAIKFTEAGQVGVRVFALTQAEECVLLRFEVTDTGIGIDPATVPRLFAPFEQADNSSTRKYGGSGLGLAITKKFAELMGGTVGASGQLGQGSMFWFTACLKTALLEPVANETVGSIPMPWGMQRKR